MWPKSARPENEEDGETGRNWRDKGIRWMLEEHFMVIESMENTASIDDAASNAGEIWELSNSRYRIRLGEEILDDELVRACLCYIALPHITIRVSTAQTESEETVWLSEQQFNTLQDTPEDVRSIDGNPETRSTLYGDACLGSTTSPVLTLPAVRKSAMGLLIYALQAATENMYSEPTSYREAVQCSDSVLWRKAMG